MFKVNNPSSRLALKVSKRSLNKKSQSVHFYLNNYTRKKFNYSHLQAKDFIKWKYGKQDVALNKLKLQFLIDFEYYLNTERKQKQVTVNTAIQRFRKPIKEAVGEEY